MEKRDPFCNRAEAFEAHDDRPLSPTGRPTIGDLIVARYSSREMLKGSLGTAAAAALFGPALLAERSHARVPDSFLFEELEAGVDETHHVAKGYRAQILLRWGDPLFADAPDSTLTTRARRSSSSSSATITITSLIFRSAKTRACSASIMSIRIKR
jgi:secreted PhoX family phosphatase